MAIDEDKLPPLGEDTLKFLEDAKKGKPRSFLLVCKGAKVSYLAVGKKPIKKSEAQEAKKLGYKGDSHFGVITGKGMDLIFNLPKTEYDSEPVKDKAVRDFLEEHAALKAKPTIQLVDSLPAIPFDEEDLKHPLVAKFMKLEPAINRVLDLRPDAKADWQNRDVEIRQLLLDAAFDMAGPKIDELIAWLKELAQGSSETSNTASTSAPPDTNGGANLLEALNKLAPQLKRAAEAHPARKVELLGPVVQIKEQIAKGELDNAKQGLLTVGKLLRELLATEASPSLSADQLRAAMNNVSPAIKQAIVEHPASKATLAPLVANFRSYLDSGELNKAKETLTEIASQLRSLKTESSPELSLAKLGKARIEWHQTRSQAIKDIEQLKEILLEEYRDDGDLQSAVAAALQRLDATIQEMNDELGTQLDLLLNAEPSRRGQYTVSARQALDNFRKFIMSDRIMSRIDGNEYVPDMRVARPLLARLNEIATVLA